MRCAPYAVSTFTNISLEQSCELFMSAGWNPEQGATLEQVHSVLTGLGVRSRIARGAGLPSKGVVFVAGQTCHAVAVRNGKIQEIKERSPLALQTWHAKHGSKYPRVVGCVEIF